MTDYQWIEGAIAVEAVLDAGSRDVAVVYVQADRRDSAAARIQRLARERGVAVERVPAEVIDGHAPDVHHAGVIASAGPRRTLSLDELLDASPNPAVVMLDGVEDPYNFGQAVRAVYAAGLSGLVLRPRNWLSASATVIRASAGATEHLPIAVVASVEDAAAAARARGLAVVAATADDARPMGEVDLAGPLLLVIGGEKRGITRSFLAQADARVRIPYGRPFAHSLGTAAATAVLAFEVARQRQGAAPR